MYIRQIKISTFLHEMILRLFIAFTSLLLMNITLYLYANDDKLAFPEAMAWGGETIGGAGGQIIKVTNLNSSGPGSFIEALKTRGPRIIVFEVGGVIDLGGQIHEIYNPYFTIAGQTAPSPGITLIRGGLYFQTHNFIIQHINLRMGWTEYEQNQGSWFKVALSLWGAHDVIIDHCSFTWDTYMGIAVTGYPFVGNNIEEWQSNMSRRITISNNIIAESLERDNSMGCMGSLVMDNATYISYIGNLFAHNYSRNPQFGGGNSVVIVNNYLYNRWDRFIEYNLHKSKWGDDPTRWILGKATIVGNYAQHGSNKAEHARNRGLVDIWSHGDLEIFEDDNIHLELDGNPAPILGRDATYGYPNPAGDFIILDEKPIWHDNIKVIPAEEVPKFISINVGARPWDRDPIDQRIVNDALNGTGKIINSENEVGGYPNYAPTYRPFNPDEWDLEYMIPLEGYWDAPEVTSPANNAVDVGSDLRLIWNADNIFTNYAVQISTDEEFSSLFLNLTNVDATSYNVDNLNNGTTYYWRIRGHNATGPSKWSEVRRFSTEDANEPLVPSKPSLDSPQNGYTGTSDTILLEWSAANNAEWYSVQVSTQSNFSTIVAQNNNLTQTFYELTDLQAPSTYYWRVRAHNSNGNSEWTEVRHFNLVLENETESQSIYLDAGWNHISSYIMPDNPSITDIFSGIENNLVVVKNDRYGVYWPEFGVNEIEEWNPTQGYQVYVEQNDVLFFSGNLLSPESTPIQLFRGWNPIAYLRTSAMPIEEALAGIHDQLELVSNNDGDVYWPALNITDLDMMIPGQGYKASVTQDVTLIYPANSEKSPARMSGDGQIVASTNSNYYKARFYVLPFNKTGDFAILLLKSPNLNDGDEVGVWSPANELVGSGVARSGQVLITVWGRNPVWNEEDGVHGATNGDMLYVTQWSTENGQEYPLPITSIRDRRGMEQVDPVLRYRSDAVWIVEANALNGIPNRYTLEQNYPNPFNPSTTIRYGIPETVNVRLEVYNAIGQRIAVLVDEEKQAGFHQVLFDANNLASGVYFLRLHAGNYISMIRTVLMR
jgi:hypothetical protein